MALKDVSRPTCACLWFSSLIRNYQAPSLFRRRAVSRLASDSDLSDDLVFPSHQNSRLKISISTESSAHVFTSPVPEGLLTLDNALKAVQTEAFDQEIFALLVKEAGNLPTASARVSERLIVIDAAQGVNLTFELVEQTFLRRP